MQLALESYDRIVGLVLDQIAVDGAITKAPGGGEAAGRSPVDRGKQGLKRLGMTDGYGIPLGRVLAGANRHGSPLLAPTPHRLEGLGPLPDTITVRLDVGYDSDTTRALPFTVSPGATSVASLSSMPSSTSPTRSSPCAARSGGPGQLTAGTNARTADRDPSAPLRSLRQIGGEEGSKERE